ncbi:MAG: hypothetical protein ACOX9C_02735 [Kiritimatiellia bacterium]
MKTSRALPLLCLVAALLGGCKTTAMKGTPFFTGEYATRVGAAEDRVNLWPLLYYRDPALSVLWPFGEYSDEHLAIRPLFSMYRRAPDKPYSEYNVLWPFVQFDTHDDSHHVFPFFWGDGHFVGFPLYWHYGPFTSSYGTDALFPLWIYDRDEGGRSLDILWPVFHRSTSRNGSRLRILPLWSSEESLDGMEYSKELLLGLVGWEAEAQNHSRAHWFLPFYATGRDNTSSGFLSLAWCDLEDATSRLRIVPPLLSWRHNDADGSRSDTCLLGLGRDVRKADGTRSGHLLPFYAYGENHVVTPLYANARSKTRTHDIVPPLLSWQSRDAATGRTDTFALGGLVHRRRGAEGHDRDWLLPLYYRDEADDLAISPLYFSSGSGDGSATRGIPPLLSWQRRDAATGASSLYALGGLAHRRRGVEGRDRDWLLPLYLRDEADGLFMTPLWAHQRDARGAALWRAIPPLLSWRSQDAATGRSDTFALGGLFHCRRGVEGRDRTWLLPLFYHDEADGLAISPLYFSSWSDDGSATRGIPPLLTWWQEKSDGSRSLDVLFRLARFTRAADGDSKGYVFPLFSYEPDSFFSLLYGDETDDDGIRTRGVWPLLSWQRVDTATGRGSRTILAGLAGHSIGMPEGHGRGHLFPLFAYDRGNDTFLTLPVGRWKGKTACYRYWFTPLVGSWDGGYNGSHGWWAQPFVFHREDVGHSSTRVLLLWSHKRAKNDSWSKTGFLPLYDFNRWRRDSDLAAALERLDAEALAEVDAASLPVRVGWHLDLFFWFGGARHQVEYITNKSTNTVHMLETAEDGVFPLWSNERRRQVVFTDGRKTDDGSLEESDLLLFLYDCRHESKPAEQHDYVRRRVLWRLWHYERLNGDVSMDMFPAITWDSRQNGYRKASFLWRLFRYEKDPEGRKKLDILFIPFMR